MSEKFSVYVDGFNLYYGLKAKSAHKYPWLDLVKLAERLRPRSTLAKVHYFTALVLNDAQGAARQSDYLAALKATNGSRIEIVQGRYQSKTTACRQCERSVAGRSPASDRTEPSSTSRCAGSSLRSRRAR
ncbi:hypothetical protein [Nocardia arizonensis]|uniref:hypothetical protein n=1 Tax=Nocardia arizonensis TaxID=1141647 RepID=UPI000A6D5FDE|nr:hypothetical protein [Nocardia arizonensis]